MTVAQYKPPIDRTSKARSQHALEQDRRSVSGADKDKALKDRYGMNGYRHFSGLTPGVPGDASHARTVSQFEI
jgi:hypothetical protein